MGLVGPGVANNGVDGSGPSQGPNSAGPSSGQVTVVQSGTTGTWADHTDIRPTLLYLTGLKDDYIGDGRVITEDLTNVSADLSSPSVEALSRAYKQLNASVGQFGAATLIAATHGIVSRGPGDARYLVVQRSLTALEGQRDSLATSIKGELWAAEFTGTPIGLGTALGQTIPPTPSSRWRNRWPRPSQPRKPFWETQPAPRRHGCGSLAPVRAVVTTGASGAIPVVAERPDPVAGRGEILIRVRAAGVNNADLLQTLGFYPAPPGSPPDILGMELAGEVVADGPRRGTLPTGERVMAVVGGGAQATLAVVHERLAMPVPDAMSWPEAGGFPEAFTTAHDALFTQGELGPGARVCIHGAAGGVGTAAVQLAAAVQARIVATVRNPDHRHLVEQLAAGVCAIDPVGFGASGPFDVILELIGAPNLPDDLAALAPGGRILVIGVGGGADAQVNLHLLMVVRGRILASTLRSRPLEQKADAARRVEAQVLPLVAAGTIRVPVVASYPIDEAPAAYARFAQGAKLGKIVLTMAEDR